MIAVNLAMDPCVKMKGFNIRIQRLQKVGPDARTLPLVKWNPLSRSASARLSSRSFMPEPRFAGAGASWLHPNR